MLENFDIQQVQDWLLTQGPVWGTRLLTAIAIFVVGRWLAKAVVALIRRGMTRTEMDPMLVGFLCSIAYMALLVAVVIGALDTLGFNTTSLVAIFGAAGLAIGLALQGSLSNFASGVMIVFFRPFVPGHFIEAAGVSGIVDTVRIFNTIIRTPDNREVIVPNSQVLGGTITNYSARNRRRVDMVFGIGYGDDIEKAKSIIASILAADERVMRDPAADIFVVELADSSVNIAVRPWVKTADYWPVRGDVMQSVKQHFDQQGITIPFPQREVHTVIAKGEAA